jgi:riboflavin kinase/FMN adenylyltransferase
MPFDMARSANDWVSHFGEQRKRSIVTIGNFDGVHLGHQQILRRVVERTCGTGRISAVLTFYPHPARVLRPEEAPGLLSTLEQRLAMIEAMGIDAAFVMQFDMELAKVSAEDFVRRFLVDTMRAEAVLVGGNFRFGHKQAGDVKMLGELGKQWGFEVEIVPPVLDGGIVISSSAIRGAIRNGQMDHARQMLGRPFSLAGGIRTGTGQGRKLVVPTLNLTTAQEVLPKMGVYATEVAVEGRAYQAVTNVGIRPTFDGTRITIESHLFDFSENLTSGPIEVRFWQRLRDEQKFFGPAELKEQVLLDIERAKEYFRAAKNS